LLRQAATGARVNEIDWENIIEEIEDVGRSSLKACRSHLRQALLHMLKAAAWPRAREVPHWLSEARVARVNAADVFAPSMRQRIDLGEIYAKAMFALPDTHDGQAPLPLPAECPVSLDELLVGAGPASPNCP
jgi:hypothetical protein